MSIKGGFKSGQLVPNGSEANIRRSVDECLRVLDGKKKIDIFECARHNLNTTIEQTVTYILRHSLVYYMQYTLIWLSAMAA